VTTGTEFCFAASATMLHPLGAINPPFACYFIVGREKEKKGISDSS